MGKKPYAFVLMPFSAEFSDVYRLGIQGAAVKAGVVAERVDDQRYLSQTILERIQHQIEIADIIIADMSGRNPNVFYEVGYAHAKGARCVLITQSAEDIPFDLKHHRHIIYGKSLTDLRNQLTKELRWIKGEIEEEENAVTLTCEQYGSINWKNKNNNSWNEVIDKSLCKVNLTLVFNIHNNGKTEIEIMDFLHLYSSVEWGWRQSVFTCPISMSDDIGFRIRSSIFPPTKMILPKTWARVQIEGDRDYGPYPLEEVGRLQIPLKGRMLLRVYTVTRNFDLPVEVNLTVSDNIS